MAVQIPSISDIPDQASGRSGLEQTRHPDICSLHPDPCLPENELRYRHHFLRQDARSFAFLAILFLLFQLMLIKVDGALGLSVAINNSLLALRIGLVLLSAAAIIASLRTGSPDRFDRWCLVWGILVALTNNLVILTRPPTYTSNMIAELVLIGAMYACLPDRTLHRMLPPVLISMGSLILFFGVKTPMGVVASISIVVGYLVANLLGYRLSSEFCRYRRTSFFNAEALELALQEAKAGRQSAEASNHQLYEAKERYRLLVQNSHGIIYEISSDGALRFVSPGWTRLLGHDVSEVVDHDFRTFVHPDDVAACENFLWKTVATGEAQQGVEYRVFHRNGTTRWHRSNILPCFNDNHEVISFVGSAVDITGYKHHQAELEQARIAADASSKAKSDFLALVSHEIRTPLTALIGFSSLARQTTDPDQCIEYLAILEESSRVLMGLVNNILDVSRIDSGQLNLELYPFNLKELINRLTSQHAPLAASKGLDFKVSSAGDIPQWVAGDPLRLQQILTNLISNAIKFTQTGCVVCSAGMGPPQDGDGRLLLRIAVRDSGIGIPENKLPLLFQPFHQLSPGITRRFGGSGLGLAIVHSLVTLMGGRIEVASHEGMGTCFTVTLPMQAAAAPAPMPSDASEMKPMDILVVEDNAFNRRLLTDTLSAGRHRVTLAENARHALALKRRNDYDLVILDVRMPDMDGIELARRLRRMEQGGPAEPAPIIAITADTLESTRQRCLDAGINIVLFKPIDPAKLALAMADQCRTRGRSGEGSSGCFLNPATMADMEYDGVRMATYQGLLLNDIAGELDCLDQAIADYDRTAAEDAAHTLKGLCGHLCEPLPKDLAIRLHHHAATSPFRQLHDMAAALRASCTPFSEMNPQLEKIQ